jgi:hypothetical protein
MYTCIDLHLFIRLFLQLFSQEPQLITTISILIFSNFFILSHTGVKPDSPFILKFAAGSLAGKQIRFWIINSTFFISTQLLILFYFISLSVYFVLTYMNHFFLITS